jgi:ArsR family transcriptional regulator
VTYLLTFNEAEYQLKAISEETRLKIISYLMVDSLCVCELVELLQMSQPSISQHVKRLKQAEIIVEERSGRWVFYSINMEHQLYTLLLQLVDKLPSSKEGIDSITFEGKRILCEQMEK